jgi:uncharacterized protein (DUF885 family)
LTAAALFTAVGLALASSVAQASPAGRTADPARAGVEDRALGEVLAAHWRLVMARNPEWASTLGDRRADARVSDPSPEASERFFHALAGLERRALAIDASTLSPSDVTWRELFLEHLATTRATEVCYDALWVISPRQNPMGDLFGTLDLQPLESGRDRQRYLARIRAAAAALDEHQVALDLGRQTGRVASVTAVRRTLEMVEAQLAEPVAAWPIVARLPGEGLDANETQRMIDRVVRDVYRPSLEAWAAYVRSTILPVARSDASPGLASLPRGDACYAARIRQQTSLPLTAATVHLEGLRATTRVEAEFRALGPSTLGTGDLPALFGRLREDPALRFADADAIVATAERALARAQAALPQALGVLPQTPCVVREIPMYEAPFTTIAYYRQPDPAGGKPGEYFVNTYAPQTRPTFEAEALAFHESVPGHHVQIARAYEQPDVPAFVRYAGSTALVEGWALYAERLADELGLYTSDTARLGMLSFDAWRSSRLVVDTGLHALGWSRDQAIAWFAAHTPLARNNIENEVDRYISWPGQALAYKLGQLTLLRLRAQAEATLGDAFDLRGFHDTVLGAGAVGLPQLEARVAAWVEAQRVASPPVANHAEGGIPAAGR